MKERGERWIEAWKAGEGMTACWRGQAYSRHRWRGGRWLLLAVLLIGMAVEGTGLGAEVDGVTADFDKANQLYEQGLYEPGRFADAVKAYQALIPARPNSPTLYFNLGNAQFKAGHNGSAIAAYRRAQELAPRDPNILFNLQFARRKVSGGDPVPASAWEGWLGWLTLNEWTVLAVGSFWLWFLLLSLREYRAGLRKPLRGYAATAGVLVALLGGGLLAAVWGRDQRSGAVVVASEAVVRYGPTTNSPAHFKLLDGSEVRVLDEKRGESGHEDTWLQVRGPDRRTGWLRRDEVAFIGPGRL